MKNLSHLLTVLVISGFLFSPVHAQETRKKPTVMVMVNEQIWVDDNIIYDYYGNLSNVINIWTSVSQTDTTLVGVFLENGFRVVGSGLANTTKGKVTKSDILKSIEGDDFTSTHLGDYLKADVVIVGKAVTRGVTVLKNSTQKSARANINIRAIRVADGEIIAAESGSATAAAIDEVSAGVDAIRKAARPIAVNFVKKINESMGINNK